MDTNARKKEPHWKIYANVGLMCVCVIEWASEWLLFCVFKPEVAAYKMNQNTQTPIQLDAQTSPITFRAIESLMHTPSIEV